MFFMGRLGQLFPLPRVPVSHSLPPGAARRSKSAPHMHVVVCMCSNVWEFQSMLSTNIGSVFAAWPCFVSQNLWLKYNDCGPPSGGGGGLQGLFKANCGTPPLYKLRQSPKLIQSLRLL